jgi:hypothetical protein
MTRLLLVLLLGVAQARVVEGHTPDEYVQALKVGVSAGRVEVHLALTPGVNIADDLLRRIDSNRDDVLSTEEAEAYGRLLIADLSALINDRPVSLTLERVEVPMPGDLRAGDAIIRVEAVITDAPRRGEHRLTIRNRHLASMSVYLANALLPKSREVAIVRQSRDLRQQTYELTYTIDGTVSQRWMWTLLAFTSLVVLVRARR